MFSKQIIDRFLEWANESFKSRELPFLSGVIVRLTAFDPDQGPEGTLVIIQGIGLAGAHTVTFGGVEATGVIQTSDRELQVVVPEYARSGPITVTSPAGRAISERPFMVVPPEEEEPALPDGE